MYCVPNRVPNYVALLYLTLVLLFTGGVIVNAQSVPGTGAVTFYRSGSSPSHHLSSGILRIYYNGMWGNICYGGSTSWGQEESDVACHQMGWSGAISYNPAGVQTSYGLDLHPAVLDSLTCSNSTYLVLLQCDLYGNGSNCRNNLLDVTISCYTTRIWDTLPSYNGLLRLVEGQYVTEGRVEVYCNGRWGTICDDALAREEANTMCRQLGYTAYVNYDHLRLPGNITQPIWLDDVICTQTETCIATCQSCPSFENHNCRHGEDFTVSCTYQVSPTSQKNQTLNTCINASSPPTVGNSLSGLVIMGIALGCGVCIFICILVVIVICCCGLKYCALPPIEDEYEMPEKAPQTSSPPPPISAVSPEIIMMMDESPKAIRKSSNTHYVTHPSPSFSNNNNVTTPTVLYSPASSSHNRGYQYNSSTATTSNPIYFNSPGDNNYEQPLTPPVFQGHPAQPPF